MNRAGAGFHGGAGNAVEIPVSGMCSTATRSRLAVAVCGYPILVVYASCPAAVQQDHIPCDLICTRYVSQGGGSIVVLPAADTNGPPETSDALTLALPCLRCCSTLWAWVVRCPAERFVQEARLTFLQVVASRRDVDPRSAV